jgi:oligopeptide transport system ATP-binding protein
MNARPDPAPASSRRRFLLQADRITKIFPVESGWFKATRFAPALQSVSVRVRRGETLGIFGEPGSGKTTLAWALVRLLTPSYGRILFDGHDITRLAEHELRPLRKRIQIVFQDFHAALNPSLRAQILLEEALSMRGAASGNGGSQGTTELLSRVGLEQSVAWRYPEELNGAQRQLICVARALAVEPDLLVLDEPLRPFDASGRQRLLGLLREEQARRHTSYLFVSQDPEALATLSQRVAVLCHGRLVEVGPAASVLAHPVHPYTNMLLRSAAARMTPGPRLSIVTEGPFRHPADAPPGCVFFRRCPRAEAGRCDKDVPPLELTNVESRHRVACYHPLDSF